jgi:hypothetical protein
MPEAGRARPIAGCRRSWEVYALYGLTSGEPLTSVDPPELALGERAFEIVLARQVAAGAVETQWFSRHGSTPITERPAHWPAEYSALVQRRIKLIESDRGIGLLERPECKRGSAPAARTSTAGPGGTSWTRPALYRTRKTHDRWPAEQLRRCWPGCGSWNRGCTSGSASRSGVSRRRWRSSSPA